MATQTKVYTHAFESVAYKMAAQGVLFAADARSERV